jgi:hypothetical protein
MCTYLPAQHDKSSNSAACNGDAAQGRPAARRRHSTAQSRQASQLRREMQALGQGIDRHKGSAALHHDYARSMLVRCALLSMVPPPEVYSMLWAACEPVLKKLSRHEVAELHWWPTVGHQCPQHSKCSGWQTWLHLSTLVSRLTCILVGRE